MTPTRSGPTHDTQATLLYLSGELDLGSVDALEARLASALELRRPIVVDIGDCTLATVDVLSSLSSAARRARERGLGFVVVLPYSASEITRVLLLELAPELVDFAIAPSHKAARAVLSGSGAGRSAARIDDARLRELRATVWESASRLEALLASRDELVLDKRRTLEQVYARRAASA